MSAFDHLPKPKDKKDRGKNVEWYTPAEWLDRARKVFGQIDLDPDSSAIAQETVQAAQFFTKEEDALQQEWHGRVWVNPPYCSPDMAHFVEKLIGELDAGRVSEAILLTENCTETGWYRAASKRAAAVGNSNKRIRFRNPDGSPGHSPTRGQSFFYFGPNVDRFRDGFGETCTILALAPEPAADPTETISTATPAPTLTRKIQAMPKLEKSFAKQIEEATEAAPAPEILRRKRDAVPDPFDLENLRVDQDFAETAGVKRLLTTIPVRKPNKQDFVRVHPDTDFCMTILMIELKDDRETYIVQRNMAEVVSEEAVPYRLYTAINRQGVVFFWPVRLPDPNGRINEWHRSMAEAAERAMTKWMRVKANMSLGAYEMFEAQGAIPDPEWPDYDYKELLRIAFRNKIVDNPDHPVVKRLQGF